jgi:UDP:flavonoid glycosyltransferase YjiC (YdhE family)
MDQARPDVLVCDFFLYGALAAGERARVPTAALVHNSSVSWPLPGLPLPPPGSRPLRGPYGRLRDRLWAIAYRRVARREAAASVNAARAFLGLPALGGAPHEQITRSERVLVMGTPAFELPLRRALPGNIRYVGTILETESSTAWAPAGDRERPWVLVSLSTLPQGQGPMMRNVLDAIGGLPIQAVVTLGPALAGESFDAPPNAQLETFVPHEAVLPHVSAVVTQCGLSTISKVLVRGLPMVCLPVLGDQPANAVRIEALGAGIRLTQHATPAAIRSAVRRVLDKPRFRVAAERYASTIQRDDPRRAVVRELESLAVGQT